MSDKYHIHGLTDLAKIREEAVRQSADSRFGPPRPVVIHFHRADEKTECERTQHEVYVEGKEVHDGYAGPAQLRG